MLIKVSGYMNTDDLDPEHVDLAHDTGLSEAGFDHFAMTGEVSLESPEFVLED